MGDRVGRGRPQGVAQHEEGSRFACLPRPGTLERWAHSPGDVKKVLQSSLASGDVSNLLDNIHPSAHGHGDLQKSRILPQKKGKGKKHAFI